MALKINTQVEETPTTSERGFKINNGLDDQDVNKREKPMSVARRGLGGYGVSGFNRGREDQLLSEAATFATELYKSYDLNFNIIKVQAYTFGMEYSSILIAKDGGDGKIYYYVILLAGTGREPQEVHYIVDNMLDKHSNVLLLPCDMLDNKAHTVFKSVIAKKFGGKEIVSLDGQVFHAIQTIEHDLADVLLVAADIVSQHIDEIQGKVLDVDADSLLLNESGTKYNRTEICMVRRGEDTINADGIPEYTDATILTEAIEEGNYYRGVENEKSTLLLSETSVVIDLLTFSDVNPNGTKLVKSVPNVIIKSLMGRAPSMGYALFCIAQATIFCSGAELQGALFEKDLGPMNLVYDFQGRGNGQGKIVSFSDSSITENEIGEFLNTHVESEAPLLMHIPYNGNGYSFLAAFSDATATVSDNSHIDGATKYVLNAASDFLGVDVPDMPILNTATFDIPTGYYIDPKTPGDKPHDLGIINECFIAKLGDTQLLNLWTIANLEPKECLTLSRVDNFQLYLTIYEKVSELTGLVIKISGRTAVVSLNPEFVNFLSEELGIAETPDGKIVDRFKPVLKDFTVFEDVNARMVPMSAGRYIGAAHQGFATADINRRRINRRPMNSQQYR